MPLLISVFVMASEVFLLPVLKPAMLVPHLGLACSVCCGEKAVCRWKEGWLLQ